MNQATHLLPWLILVSAWAFAADEKPNRIIENAQSAAISQALNRPTTVEYAETPLRDVCDFLASQHEINIVLDVRTFDDQGIDIDLPVTARFKAAKLRTVLDKILTPHGAIFRYHKQVLLITTKEGLRRLKPVNVPKRIEPGVERALKAKTAIEFVETPLQDVADFLADMHKVKIELANTPKVQKDLPITFQVSRIPLKCALGLLAELNGLELQIQRDRLVIGVPKK